MKTFCTILGELLIAAAMVAVPILCALSIALGWSFDAKTSLVIASLLDYIATWWCVMVTVDEMEG
jgi:hypothetical protein